jgi:hypothetical protein
MREIRLSGSVRGVRRNPYPYRDLPKTDAVGSAGFTMPSQRGATDPLVTLPCELWASHAGATEKRL